MGAALISDFTVDQIAACTTYIVHCTYGATGKDIHRNFLFKGQKLGEDSSIDFFVLQSVIEGQARKLERPTDYVSHGSWNSIRP